MSKKIYLISHFGANPHHRAGGENPRSSNSEGTVRTLARRAALLTVAVGALLFGLSACSPRPPGGTSGASGRTAPAPVAASSGTAKGSAASPLETAGTAVRNGPTAAATGAGTTAGGGSKPASAGTAQPATRSTAAATSGPSAAYVSFVTGSVTGLLPPKAGEAAASSPQPRRLRVADGLGAGELIRTAKGSAAEIRVGNLFDVGIGEGASARFDTIAAGASHRLVLTLERGALQVKAGADLMTGGSPAAADRILLEIHTPHLFVSSRGGSLLVTESVDSTLCAVGRGRAWLLPSSVVYPNLVKTVENPQALRLLNAILARAVGLSKHEEVTVPASRLETIDGLGGGLRAILKREQGARSYPQSTATRFAELAGKAADEVAASIGKPRALSKALESQLDPASVYHQKMKTVSSTETGPSTAKTSSTTPSPAAARSESDVAHTPSATLAAPAAGSATTPASGTSSSGSPAVNEASSPSGGASTTTNTTGVFPGPTPPTPPTPPSVP